MRERRRRGAPRSGTVVLIIVLSLVLVPAVHAVQPKVNGVPGGGCVQISWDTPPGVGMDPECKPNLWGSQSSQGIDADATLAGTGVTVDWNITQEVPEIDRFTVLRGETPWTLTPIVYVDNSTRGYTDLGAAWTGEAIWYQVVALDDGEIVARSQTTLATPHT